MRTYGAAPRLLARPLTVDATLGVVAAHDIANEAHHRLLHDVPKLSDVTIHVSPEPADDTDHHDVLAHHA